MKKESESAIQSFSVRMAEGPNSDCKRSATHSPDCWCEIYGLFMAGECKFVQLRELIVFGRDTVGVLNRLTPNDPYMGRTAPLTSKRCNLYIYLTNIGTEYFKHALYSPFSSLQNAFCFIMLTCLVPVLFTFYIQVCKN